MTQLLFNEKKCFKCLEILPLDRFYKHKIMLDGHLNKCKNCAKKDVRNHRINNPDLLKERDSKRPRRNTKYVCPPEQKKVYSKLSHAVKSGKLVKTPCAFCKSKDKLEAHHHDYGKPLDVTWLCSSCHRRFHALERISTYEKEKEC